MHMEGLQTIIGLFNIVAGLMLVSSILLMVGGLGVWYVRLGTFPTYRDDAIVIMRWGVSILFVLVVLLGVAQYVQTHMSIAMLAIGVVIVAAIAYFVASTMMAGGGGEEEHH